MSVCQDCGVPRDAGFFDHSSIVRAPEPGQEELLARYELHRNHCGMLLYFSQFTDKYASNPTLVRTPGYQWQILCNRQPRHPYLTFEHVINPWGMSGFPLRLRLEQGSVVEFVIRNVGPGPGDPELGEVGGRIVGSYWYDTNYGGVPNPL
jgi:hypothetical protein